MTIFITLLTAIIIYLVVVARRGKGRLRSKRYEKKINNSPEPPKLYLNQNLVEKMQIHQDWERIR